MKGRYCQIRMEKLKSLLRMLLILVGAELIVGCSDAIDDEILLYSVKYRAIRIEVPAKGELEAKQATPLTLPSGIFEPQQLSWMVDENSVVKKGEVIARLNGTKYQFKSNQEMYKRQQISIEQQVKNQALLNEEMDIRSDGRLIREELTIANRFTIDDLRLFSKNEIIDKLNDKDYLGARLDNNDWRWDSFTEMSSTERELLELQQKEIDTKLNMYQDSLSKMDIKAPHDGVFVLTKNWRGEKTKVGQILFPGSKIGSLPDLSEMQARLFVLESESSNIQPGQKITIFLNAYPETAYAGNVLSVDPVAKTRNRDNPVKYFQVMIELDLTDTSRMHPGNHLDARIVLLEQEKGIMIPSFLIDEENGEYFVPLWKGTGIERRRIEIGLMASDFTEVKTGLSQGDRLLIQVKDKES